MGTYHVNSDKMLNELRELKKVENDGDRYPHTTSHDCDVSSLRRH